jgi:hypothetical protein
MKCDDEIDGLPLLPVSDGRPKNCIEKSGSLAPDTFRSCQIPLAQKHHHPIRLTVSADATARVSSLACSRKISNGVLDRRYGQHWLLCNGREVVLVNEIAEGR